LAAESGAGSAGRMGFELEVEWARVKASRLGAGWAVAKGEGSGQKTAGRLALGKGAMKELARVLGLERMTGLARAGVLEVAWGQSLGASLAAAKVVGREVGWVKN